MMTDLAKAKFCSEMAKAKNAPASGVRFRLVGRDFNGIEEKQ